MERNLKTANHLIIHMNKSTYLNIAKLSLRRRVVLNHFTVQFVLNTNFDLIKIVQNVQLRDCEATRKCCIFNMFWALK